MNRIFRANKAPFRYNLPFKYPDWPLPGSPA